MWDKETLGTKTKRFFREHFDQILLVTEFVGGVTVGAVFGSTFGKAAGVKETTKLFAGKMETIINECGKAGMFAGLDAVDEQTGGITGNLDPDKLGRRACRLYYEDEFVKDAVDFCKRNK